MRLLLLVPALALAGCANMTQEDYNTLSQALSQANVTTQQMQQSTAQMVQQTQINPNNLQPYSYQRSDGVWVYCNRTSSYTVSCRTN